MSWERGLNVGGMIGHRMNDISSRGGHSLSRFLADIIIYHMVSKLLRRPVDDGSMRVSCVCNDERNSRKIGDASTYICASNVRHCLHAWNTHAKLSLDGRTPRGCTEGRGWY